jgi:hypothetical protein
MFLSNVFIFGVFNPEVARKMSILVIQTQTESCSDEIDRHCRSTSHRQFPRVGHDFITRRQKTLTAHCVNIDCSCHMNSDCSNLSK